MNRILTIAGTEFRIARRNRWITVSAVLMMIFALVLTAAGSAPSGALAADRLSVVVATRPPYRAGAASRRLTCPAPSC